MGLRTKIFCGVYAFLGLVASSFAVYTVLGDDYIITSYELGTLFIWLCFMIGPLLCIITYTYGDEGNKLKRGFLWFIIPLLILVLFPDGNTKGIMFIIVGYLMSCLLAGFLMIKPKLMETLFAGILLLGIGFRWVMSLLVAPILSFHAFMYDGCSILTQCDWQYENERPI